MIDEIQYSDNLSLIKDFANFHTIKDQLDVGIVSDRGTFNLLSASLQRSIRFFQPPKPAFPTVFLAVNLPLKAEIQGFQVPCLMTLIT